MARQIIFRSRVKKAAGIALDAWETGLRSIKKDVKAEIQALLGKPSPPVSRPFTPPHKVSGKLQGGITVTVEKGARGRAAAIVVKTNTAYGRALEFGYAPNNLAPRPYIRKALIAGGRRGSKLKKKWIDKITRTAKRKASSRRTTSRRR